MARFLAAAAATLLLASTSAASPAIGVAWSAAGAYNITLDGAAWLSSAPSSVCVRGAATALAFGSAAPASGSDALGAWTGAAATFATADAAAAPVVFTSKLYAARPGTAVLTASFPRGLDTSGCGKNTELSTRFPAFDTGAALAPTLGFVSWRGTALATTVATRGLAALAQGGLDAGPVVATDGGSATGASLAWSTLDFHKIVVQTTSAGAAPLTSLWSAERSDQVACLSALCAQDQVADGAYTTQRVEGFGVSAADVDAATGLAAIGGRQFATLPLSFAWSSNKMDNFVSNSSAPLPDGSYSTMGANGVVLADGSAPGSLPLRVCSRVYNASHTDFATLASADGLAWASANGYVCAPSAAGYVLPSAGAAAGSYAMGLSAAVPSIPAGWAHSVVFSAASGGVTSATYALGAQLQAFYGTTRQPSVTLTDVGYYTDDGAYYYVWEAFGCCNPTTHEPRPWAAEEGLVLVKEDLWQRGVPVAYMQMDDWWYQGKFYFGNVKVVEDWHPSNVTRLFPSGDGLLANFQKQLGIPLQLYTPFWSEDKFDTENKYNMTPSTVFANTKLVVPNDSYRFFSDWFDLGAEITGSRETL